MKSIITILFIVSFPYIASCQYENYGKSIQIFHYGEIIVPDTRYEYIPHHGRNGVILSWPVNLVYLFKNNYNDENWDPRYFFGLFIEPRYSFATNHANTATHMRIGTGNDKKQIQKFIDAGIIINAKSAGPIAGIGFGWFSVPGYNWHTGLYWL